MNGGRVVLAAPSATIRLLRSTVREIEDFPRKGIWTQDMTPILQDAQLFNSLVMELARLLADEDIDVIAGVESRGFMIGPPLALALGKPFVPVVKASHALPGSVQEKYTYEYGSSALALLPGPVHEGMRVLIVDDQIVTGGTVLAAAALVEKLGAHVAGCAFVLVQSHYDGLRSVAKYPVFALFEKNPSHMDGAEKEPEGPEKILSTNP